jgi:hypothetical protein
MKIPIVLSFVGFVIMLGAILSGFIWGNFLEEGAIITSVLWGNISLIDVYIGFLIFIAWIVYRERSVLLTIVWIIAVLVLGNLSTCLYLIIAFYQSGGNIDRFFRGRHAEPQE